MYTLSIKNWQRSCHRIYASLDQRQTISSAVCLKIQSNPSKKFRSRSRQIWNGVEQLIQSVKPYVFASFVATVEKFNRYVDSQHHSNISISSSAKVFVCKHCFAGLKNFRQRDTVNVGLDHREFWCYQRSDFENRFDNVHQPNKTRQRSLYVLVTNAISSIHICGIEACCMRI